jgi:dTDP-4-amino-4,6-dideoxygalactose transaminase
MPPTAGLPLLWGDFFGAGGDFAAAAREFLGAPRGGLASSGTACLIVILTTLHRLSGRRTVIAPAWTCPLVALAVARCGLSLRLCDLAEDGLDFDPEALARLCDADTLALLPTHLAGRAADVDSARTIAQKHGAFVVEDAAQAFGAKRNGQSVGLAGDAGFFSFAVGKGLSLYEGGVWVTRDAALAAEFSRTAGDFLAQDGGMEFRRGLELMAYMLFYRPALLPWVYGQPLRRALKRGDFLSAAGDIFSPAIPLHRVSRWRQGIGCRALARLRDFQRQTEERAKRRLAALDALSGVRVFRDREGEKGVWPFFLLRLPDEKTRDDALKILWGAGLGVTRLFIHALPDYAYLRPLTPEIAQAGCDRARSLAARSLTVTNSLWLSDAGFSRITAVLEESLAG